MRMVPGRFVRLLVDEFDFSGDTSGVTLALTGSAIDAPALQQTALQRIAGDAGLKVEHSGYYTGPDAGELEAELTARLGTETPAAVAVLLDTRAVGNPAYVAWRAWGEQVTVETPIDGLVTLSGAWGEMPGYRGVVLFDGMMPPGQIVGPRVHLGPAALQAGLTGGLFVFVRAAPPGNRMVVIYTAPDAQSNGDAVGGVSFDGVGVFEGMVFWDDAPEPRYVRVEFDGSDQGEGVEFTAVLWLGGVTM